MSKCGRKPPERERNERRQIVTRENRRRKTEGRQKKRQMAVLYMDVTVTEVVSDNTLYQNSNRNRTLRSYCKCCLSCPLSHIRKLGEPGKYWTAVLFAPYHINEQQRTQNTMSIML